MTQRAIIVWGGWDGHEPEKVGKIFESVLAAEGFEVTRTNSLEPFEDAEALAEFDLIVPIWTMGSISNTAVENVSNVVAGGTGIAGCHGGMCDSFRDSVTWQFITGGNWVSHPGGEDVTYTVNIVNSSSELTSGIEDFEVTSEQYYLHVDPAVEVLASTRHPGYKWYHSSNRAVDVPAVWTKRWGHGRVYYNSLGHSASVMEMASPIELMRRGFLWAASGKQIAREQDLSASDFQ